MPSANKDSLCSLPRNSSNSQCVTCRSSVKKRSCPVDMLVVRGTQQKYDALLYDG